MKIDELFAITGNVVAQNKDQLIIKSSSLAYHVVDLLNVPNNIRFIFRRNKDRDWDNFDAQKELASALNSM